ncbi:hypothetical protein HMPREF9080_00195 [Cardiobacterium valvarum F0432]|uniref:Uncharacterized protein n=1 Tax=Cardiobacterium valvarum F0432 TaxID=797473 RepID=G9ZBR8_9GAMM|nr:hypothetical protein HMPREF9080_00195 [Cardiobacterium valvarum F0432]
MEIWSCSHHGNVSRLSDADLILALSCLPSFYFPCDSPDYRRRPKSRDR